MILATYEEFESEEVGKAIYIPAYHDFPYFKTRCEWFQHHFAHHRPPGKVCVIGCGWGYLVKRLFEAGYNAIGIDASEYAINRGREELPEIADRLFVRDITKPGLTFDDAVVITEDLLPCLDDDECELALTYTRRGNPAAIVHMLTSNDRHFGGKSVDTRFNWKPSIIWQRLVWPDLVYDVDTNEAIA